MRKMGTLAVFGIRHKEENILNSKPKRETTTLYFPRTRKGISGPPLFRRDTRKYTNTGKLDVPDLSRNQSERSKV